MLKPLGAILSAMATIAMLGLTAQPANAQTCTGGTCYGGKVVYSYKNAKAYSSVLVCKNWGSTACISGDWFSLPYGKSSKSYVFDADGFHVPDSCNFYVGNTVYHGPKWVKIGDLTSAAVEAYCY